MPPKVQQISALLENRVGRLMGLTKAVGNEAINILGLSVVNAADFAIVHLVVDQTELAVKSLEEMGMSSIVHEVIAVEVPDLPGGLAKILQVLAQAELNVQYTYSLHTKSERNAVIILRITDVDGAAQILEESGLRLLSLEEICGGEFV